MKKIVIAFMLGMSMLFMQAHAEPTFNQVQTLIAQQEYRAAEKGLEEIIKNHPNSAKAFYAMAQAQAGLGNLTKAQHALDKAMGLNPALDFAPQSSVDNLKQAIHPQVAKIEIIEESHFWRNVFLIILFGVIGYVGYVLYDNHQKSKKRKELIEKEASLLRYTEYKKRLSETKPKNEFKAELKTPVVSSGFASVKPAPAKDERIYAGGSPTLPTPVPIQKTEVRTSPSGYNASPVVTPAPVVVNNTTSNNSATDFMLGAMMGHVLTANNSSHKEVVREKVIEREVPAETKSSSWDEAPTTPSRSSTWDSDSSSKRSSSWDDDSSSSSKSSSSWSSSSSDSSFSWDSGSSSSDSSSSSSSWD